MEAKVLGIFISVCSSRDGHFGKIWPHPAVLRSPRPNNNPGGITAPPSVNRLPKEPAGTQPPLISPRDKAHPAEGQESAPPTSGQAPVPHIRKPTASPISTSAIRGADIRSKRSYNPIVCKKETTSKIYTE